MQKSKDSLSHNAQLVLFIVSISREGERRCCEGGEGGERGREEVRWIITLHQQRYDHSRPS